MREVTESDSDACVTAPTRWSEADARPTRKRPCGMRTLGIACESAGHRPTKRGRSSLRTPQGQRTRKYALTPRLPPPQRAPTWYWAAFRPERMRIRTEKAPPLRTTPLTAPSPYASPGKAAEMSVTVPPGWQGEALVLT